MTAERLWTLPRVGAPLPSPDGRHLCVAVAEPDPDTGSLHTSRLWLVPTGGGIARPLTHPGRHATEPSFSPDGRRLAFCTAPRPEPHTRPEPAQIALLSLEGGEAEVLTDVGLGAFDPQWLPDSSGLVFGVRLFDGHLTLSASAAEKARREEHPVRVHATEERLFRFWDRWLVDGKLPHLFVLDLTRRELKDLMPHSTRHFEWMDPSGSFEILPTGRELVFTAIAPDGKDGRPRRDVYRLRLGEDEPRCLTADFPEGGFGARVAPDGLSVVVGWKEDPDFYADRVRLARIDLPTGARTPILEDWDRSPTNWCFAPDGTLVFTAEDEGRVRAWRLDLAGAPGARPVPLTQGGTFTNARPASDGAIYGLHHTLVSPPEAARMDPDTGKIERLTAFADGKLENVRRPAVRSIVFEGAEGADVQMFVLLPPGFREDGTRPLVHFIHGGPHGMFGDAWHWRWHAWTLAARGYVVACVNFHGSTSWGQDFAACIQGAWGEKPTKDVLKATDVLVEMGWVDDKRMAIAGGSYGGYLTAWLASTSSRFACAINHAGVYDLALQYASDVTFARHRANGGHIWKAPSAVDRFNPARHAAGLETPMLVIHGERDYRVPVDQ